jgi:hypothetical protein
LASYCDSYDTSEKYSIILTGKVEKRQAQPLRRPLLLEKNPRLLLDKIPSRFVFHKEKRVRKRKMPWEI